MDKKKILIIDDEKNICELMKINLESIGGFEVAVAYSGEEGIKKAKQVNFDLVITDYRMPGMDGKAVLDTLKKMKPHSPVVLFSIYYDDQSKVISSIKSKADGIISKPATHEQIYKAVNDALAKRKNNIDSK